MQICYMNVILFGALIGILISILFDSWILNVTLICFSILILNVIWFLNETLRPISNNYEIEIFYVIGIEILYDEIGIWSEIWRSF